MTFITTSAQAQDYVIFHSGNKLHGIVLKNFDYNNYRSLLFRDESGQQIKYGPVEIYGFEVESCRTFIMKTLPVNERPDFVQRVFSGTLNFDHINGRFIRKHP